MIAPPLNPQSALETAHIVINEQNVIRFKFYLQNAIRDGMRHGGELYQLMHEVKASERLEAYRLGHELALKGLSIIITASKLRYIVWANLRVPLTSS